MSKHKYNPANMIDFNGVAPKTLARRYLKACPECGTEQHIGHRFCKGEGCEHQFGKVVTPKPEIPPEMPVAVATVPEFEPVAQTIQDCMPNEFVYVGTLTNPLINYSLYVATCPKYNGGEPITGKTLRQLMDKCWSYVHDVT